MNREEKLQYQEDIESYFENKKVYDLFEKLLKELVIYKPQKPIDYLIDRLKKKDTKRFFITSGSGTERKEVALAVANELGYKHISMGDLIQKELLKKLETSKKIQKSTTNYNLVEDDIAIELFKNEAIKYKDESYIVEGFPRSRVQAMYLKSVGILPDCVVVLNTTRNKAEEHIISKLKQSGIKENGERIAKNSFDESELAMNAIREIYKGFLSEIPTFNKTQNSIAEEISHIFKYKNKTSAPRRPPKILLMGPPCSKKYELAQQISRKYNIPHISISDLLQQEIKSQNENSIAIINAMNSGELVNDRYIFKLLEDRLYASDCMINGWILTGFPKTKSQWNYLEEVNHSFYPSLVVVINLLNEESKARSKSRRIDPVTGKFYQIDSDVYERENEVLRKRLIVKTEDKPEILNRRLENWNVVNNMLEEIQNANVLRINGELSVYNLIEKISDGMENDS